jgi:hypothetical protein
MVDYSVAVSGASTKRLVLIRSPYGLQKDGHSPQSRGSLTRVHVAYPCHSCIRTRSISALFGSWVNYPFPFFRIPRSRHGRAPLN